MTLFCYEMKELGPPLPNELVWHFFAKHMVWCRFSDRNAYVCVSAHARSDVSASSISDTTYKGPSAFSLTPTMVIEHVSTFGFPLHLPMHFGSKIQVAAFQLGQEAWETRR